MNLDGVCGSILKEGYRLKRSNFKHRLRIESFYDVTKFSALSGLDLRFEGTAPAKTKFCGWESSEGCCSDGVCAVLEIWVNNFQTVFVIVRKIRQNMV